MSVITNPFYTSDLIRNRLSISSIIYWGHRPIGEGALEELSRNGFTILELIDSPEQFDMAEPSSMRALGDACRSCGIRVGAFHAHFTNFSGVATEHQRYLRVDLCRRQIDQMLELGGALWGCHAWETNTILFKSLEDLARHVEGTEAVVTIENFKEEAQSVENRVAFLDRLNHPQVGLILDIGHVRNTEGMNPMTCPRGPAEILHTCGDHLKHLHLHGYNEGTDHFPPFTGGDSILWKELFQSLHASGYSGLFNLEVRGEPKNKDAVKLCSFFPERIAEEAAL
jgi:sugar phosphate isomerase/epimerase